VNLFQFMVVKRCLIHGMSQVSVFEWKCEMMYVDEITEIIKGGIRVRQMMLYVDELNF